MARQCAFGKRTVYLDGQRVEVDIVKVLGFRPMSSQMGMEDWGSDGKTYSTRR